MESLTKLPSGYDARPGYEKPSANDSLGGYQRGRDAMRASDRGAQSRGVYRDPSPTADRTRRGSAWGDYGSAPSGRLELTRCREPRRHVRRRRGGGFGGGRGGGGRWRRPQTMRGGRTLDAFNESHAEVSNKMGALATIRTGMRGLAGVVLFAAIWRGPRTRSHGQATAPWAQDQLTFASAKEAADAFVAALRTQRGGALEAIFGPRSNARAHRQDGGPRDRQRLAEAAAEALVLREDAPDQVTLVLGAKAWPFPIPLVRGDRRAGASTPRPGIEELQNRVVGEHELAAIELARSYVDAQTEYAREDRDGDQVLEYAQNRSTPGRKDGLHWESKDGEASAPSARSCGRRRLCEGQARGRPLQRVLLQGADAPGRESARRRLRLRDQRQHDRRLRAAGGACGLRQSRES